MKSPLAALQSPGRVAITCAIVSPNAQASPMTGFFAAAFHVRLYQRYRGDLAPERRRTTASRSSRGSAR